MRIKYRLSFLFTIRLIVLVTCVLAFPPSASAQKTKTPKPEKKVEKKDKELSGDAALDERKVTDIVKFLEYLLNTVGSGDAAVRDKDIVITESYSKIFRDAKVQIEDDLDEARKVITNKDIVAYLKDVDFFFKDIKFEFTIEDIKKSTLPNGELFYKVSLRRNLQGVGSDGQLVNNTKPRFIEINYNPDDQDLKIVSIYTNEFDEKESLTNWWNSLSYEWQSIFKKKINVTDSISLNDIKNITATEELDLSSNAYIQNLEPLTQLVNLKLLNLSSTPVSDLTPIRNLTELVELDLSGTKIGDISALRYATKLIRLNLNQTEITDITVVERMPKLQNLELGSTAITDFNAIGNLVDLVHLNVSGTAISDLMAVQNLQRLLELNISSTLIVDLRPVTPLKSLTTLNIDSTRVRSLDPLSGLENLKVLHANYTLISDLKPLQKLVHLDRVYCDQTMVTREMAYDFMNANPKVLVVFDSKDLKLWWETLPMEWRQALSKTGGISVAGPSKEELAKITNVDSINLGRNSSIRSFEPLRKLQKLRVVIADKTQVNDLSPLKDHEDIRYLDIRETPVKDLSTLRQFLKLKVLLADKTNIENIDPLFGISGLQKLYVDHTVVHDLIAREFLEKNPTCLIIYKTIHLKRWWKNLSTEWNELLTLQMKSDTTKTRENLHALVEREALHFSDASVSDLTALNEFVRLRELHFSGTAIKSIPPLENLRTLKSLHATNSPIGKIESIGSFADLEDLDISNTAIDDLRPIGALINLKKLNCAGTQIRRLDTMEKLPQLEYLDCSNTRISNLDPLLSLPLKTLKCYNTKVSSREVENFKKRNPNCNVIYYR